MAEHDKAIKEKVKQEREQQKKTEDDVTIASDDSFPASDPPSWTGVTGPGDVENKDKDKDKDEDKKK